MSADRDPVDELMHRCLERPEPEWPAALEAECRAHPEQAARLRRRFELLRETGLVGAPPRARVGPYRLLAPLGSGGMGVVYAAVHDGTGQRVALKVIRPELLFAPTARARFEREVAIARRLDHPHLCRVLDGGEADGVPYIAMPLLAGETLAARLARASEPNAPRNRVALAPHLELFEKLARALHVAHQAGLVHRDVKPANILITAGDEPVLLDFGLARDLAAAEKLTASSALLGTPVYLAPEALSRPGELDARADVYALGVALYETLTRRVPFAAASREQLFRQILTAEPARPSRLDPALPRTVDHVVLRSLAKQPRDRYQSALDLAEDLRRLRAGERVQARPPRWSRRLVAWGARRPLGAAALLLMIGGGALAGVLWWRQEVGERLPRALQLAAESSELLANDPERALDQAMAAVTLSASERTLSQLANVLSQIHESRALPARSGPVDFVVPATDGRHFLTGASTGVLRAWRDDALVGELSEARGGISGVAFVVGWPRVVVSARDGSARVHDLATGSAVELAAPRADVTGVACARDGSLLATASTDGVARLWRPDGTLVAALDARAGPLACVDVAAEGQAVLAAARDGSVHAWDAAGRELAVWRGGGGRLSRALFAPDGRAMLAVEESSGSDRAWLWSGEAGEPPRVLAGNEGRVRALCFAPDGRSVLVAGDDQTARVFATGGGEPIVLRHGAPVVDAAFAPDGGRIATATGDGNAHLFTRRGDEIGVLRGHHSRLTAVAFLDQARLLTASADGSARLWQAEPVLPVLRGSRGPLLGAAFVPTGDGGEQIVTATKGGTVTTWDRAGHRLASFAAGHTGEVTAAIASRDGARLLTTSTDGSARVFDRDGTLRAVLAGHVQDVMSAAFAPQGDLVATASLDHTARLWRLEAQGATSVATLAHPDSVICVAFSADGQQLATGDEEGVIRRFDGAGRELGGFAAHEDRIWSLAFSPCGDFLLSASRDCSARVSHLDGRLRTKLPHEKTVAAAAFSPDGRRVVTACTDQSARVFALDGALELRLAGHRAMVWCVAFDASGESVLTGDSDGTARVWPITRDGLLAVAARVQSAR